MACSLKPFGSGKVVVAQRAPRRTADSRHAPLRVAAQATSAPLSSSSAPTPTSPTASRRAVLSAAAAAPLLALLQGPASASPLQDLVRGALRPDVALKDAVVVMLDAKSTLKEIQAIAATAPDSEERFHARALWPSLAKRLRAVAEAAPVVAALVTGAVDKEATLSEMYGGKGAEGSAVTDQVYMGLGRVLTISGRTIRPEAQASPGAAKEAELAIEGFLQKVPGDLLSAAQDFRKERAKLAAA